MTTETEARLDKHEAICAERYKQIEETLKRIDQRTEQHSLAINGLTTKSSQYIGAWKTMVALGTIVSTIYCLLKITGKI